jgi:hypothetical protein
MKNKFQKTMHLFPKGKKKPEAKTPLVLLILITNKNTPEIGV